MWGRFAYEVFLFGTRCSKREEQPHCVGCPTPVPAETCQTHSVIVITYITKATSVSLQGFQVCDFLRSSKL